MNDERDFYKSYPSDEESGSAAHEEQPTAYEAQPPAAPPQQPPVYRQQPPPSAQPPRQEEFYRPPVYHAATVVEKRKWPKRLLLSIAGVLCVAIISLASVGAYTLFFAPDEADTAGTTPTDTPTVVKPATDGEALSVSEIAAKVSPSVVSIVVQTTATNYWGMDQAAEGSGTGVIMNTDGYILTNAHVVSGASSIMVTTADGSEYQAKLIGYDEQTDVGVIKIDGKDLTAAEFGDSDSLAVGDAVVAIGNPLGTELTGTVTNGIVSYLDRELTVGGTTYNYIQTNAGINSGNSGGPLVNDQGLVIGINSAKVDSSVAEGIGFALPINEVMPVADELIDRGYVSGRPLIGITGQDIDKESAEYYQVPVGAYVVSVQEGSPAAAAGLRAKDIITAINGEEVDGMTALNNEKANYKPGDTIELSVYRLETRESLTMELTLGEQTAE